MVFYQCECFPGSRSFPFGLKSHPTCRLVSLNMIMTIMNLSFVCLLNNRDVNMIWVGPNIETWAFPTLPSSNRLAFSLQGTVAAVSSFFTGVGSDVGENHQCEAQPSSSAVVPWREKLPPAVFRSWGNNNMMTRNVDTVIYPYIF